MTRILFICLGNICRSPMAEYVMKDLTSKAGLSEQFEIASAATSAWEIGNPVYPPARQKLALGSAGPAVLQVQKWLNIIAAADQTADFVPETGLFDTETQAALESYQLTAGLETLGVVDADTWESLRLAAQGLCRECQEG